MYRCSRIQYTYKGYASTFLQMPHRRSLCGSNTLFNHNRITFTLVLTYSGRATASPASANNKRCPARTEIIAMGNFRGHGNTSSTLSGSSNGQMRSRVNRSKRERLRNMKVFVLDNSLRESTVGQAVGHSTEDKMKVFDATSSCGFKHQIVGCFSTNNRVDDKFAAELQKMQFPDRTFYSFSEVYEKLDDKGRFMKDHVPIGLKKMQKFGIINPII